jgi:hypothetical protein
VAEVFSEQELAGTLFSTSIGFDLSVFELFAPLCLGGAVIVVGNVLQLAELPNANRVTLVNTVPSAMAALLDIGGVPESVRTVNLAGEPLPGPLARQTCALTHVTKLHNLYGPTEDTTYSTCALVTPIAAEAPTIGRPITNTRCYVLDRWLSPSPPGVAGEIYLGGDGLARGYLNRPEITTERFVPDPFSAVQGARLYRTGDLARYRPDGNLEFLGRLDDQVKIRGFRIEPGEIESVLTEHPAVRQAAVIAREDTPGERRLVAYVVPADQSATDIEPLRAFLRGRLPDYMRPAAYVLLERLPLTPNGKIDRHALPAPAPEAGANDAYEAPIGEVETLVSRIWAEVLALEQVGRHDNFFDLGGHSLLAVKFVGLLRDRGGVDLPIGTLFESPTPAALARRLSIEHEPAGVGDAGSRGALRLVMRPPARAAAGGGHASIAEILGRQREWVTRWKGSRATPDSFIVTLNESGARAGLFWCLQAHHELAQLARHLGPDQPVHGMRSGHDVMAYTDENVRALASCYAAEMIALQPDGPLLLGGNCQGGRIAQAIAQRLRELGRAASLLILMERGSFPSYDGPVALIFGRDSRFNPYKPGADPDAVFRRTYPAGFTVDIVAGAHGDFFRSPNVETLASALERRLPGPPR